MNYYFIYFFLIFSGKRVIGALKSGATSTLVKTNPFFTWEIPDEWSFEDAVTIPIVYCKKIINFCLFDFYIFFCRYSLLWFIEIGENSEG